MYKRILLAIFLYCASDVQAIVVLSEVMFDPSGEESSDEFIELYNNSALPVQLAGWTISDGEGTDTLADAGQGLTLAPFQYALIIDPDYVEDGSTTYDGIVPESALIVSLDNGTFGSRGFSNSEGEFVRIQNASGVVVSEYQYSVGNLSGHSDEKIRVSDGNESLNWNDSMPLHGTPGSRNSVTPPDRDLGLVGIRVEPDYPQPSQDYQLSVIIENFGLQAMSSSLTLLGDSLGTGNSYLLAEAQLGSVMAGDSIIVENVFRMPESGIQLITAVLSQVDNDTTNNHLSFLVSSEVSSSGLRINEIQFDPIVGRSEWIEITVAGLVPVATRGFSISDGLGIADSLERMLLPDWVLAPGAFVVISKDSAVFLEDIPLEVPVAVLSTGSFTLNNNGDSLVVYSPSGEVVERVDFRSNWGDGVKGIAIERVTMSAASNDPVNWGSCVDVHGSTPGRINSRSIVRPGATTSLSVLPSPFTPNGDGIDDVTEIRFQSESAGFPVSVKIFDTRGRLVRRISGGEGQSESGVMLWDGRMSDGSLASTARYIVLLEAENRDGGVSRERTTVILARPQ